MQARDVCRTYAYVCITLLTVLLCVRAQAHADDVIDGSCKKCNAATAGVNVYGIDD